LYTRSSSEKIDPEGTPRSTKKPPLSKRWVEAGRIRESTTSYQMNRLGFFLVSQTWLPTVEDVLQADLQGVWHSRYAVVHLWPRPDSEDCDISLGSSVRYDLHESTDSGPCYRGTRGYQPGHLPHRHA